MVNTQQNPRDIVKTVVSTKSEDLKIARSSNTTDERLNLAITRKRAKLVLDLNEQSRPENADGVSYEAGLHIGKGNYIELTLVGDGSGAKVLDEKGKQIGYITSEGELEPTGESSVSRGAKLQLLDSVVRQGLKADSGTIRGEGDSRLSSQLFNTPNYGSDLRQELVRGVLEQARSLGAQRIDGVDGEAYIVPSREDNNAMTLTIHNDGRVELSLLENGGYSSYSDIESIRKKLT